ncbi:MAG: hypothetical protein ATN31_10125 [Candidatus Epulonipiscioides saccharophilum]|nr:MAG: hypothetical protein ATN31_10125 [Epulopiscium sp. AS2M-Bin001]
MEFLVFLVTTILMLTLLGISWLFISFTNVSKKSIAGFWVTIIAVSSILIISVYFVAATLEIFPYLDRVYSDRFSNDTQYLTDLLRPLLNDYFIDRFKELLISNITWLQNNTLWFVLLSILMSVAMILSLTGLITMITALFISILLSLFVASPFQHTYIAVLKLSIIGIVLAIPSLIIAGLIDIFIEIDFLTIFMLVFVVRILLSIYSKKSNPTRYIRVLIFGILSSLSLGVICAVIMFIFDMNAMELTFESIVILSGLVFLFIYISTIWTGLGIIGLMKKLDDYFAIRAKIDRIFEFKSINPRLIEISDIQEDKKNQSKITVLIQDEKVKSTKRSDIFNKSIDRNKSRNRRINFFSRVKDSITDFLSSRKDNIIAVDNLQDNSTIDFLSSIEDSIIESAVDNLQDNSTIDFFSTVKDNIIDCFNTVKDNNIIDFFSTIKDKILDFFDKVKASIENYSDKSN